VRYYYLDADSFLELKVEIQTTIRGAFQESELYYVYYEQVNGIFYPFAVEQVQKGSASRRRSRSKRSNKMHRSKTLRQSDVSARFG
jgi:hypothetical protein